MIVLAMLALSMMLLSELTAFLVLLLLHLFL